MRGDPRIGRGCSSVNTCPEYTEQDNEQGRSKGRIYEENK
jgi:hypothetical protein